MERPASWLILMACVATIASVPAGQAAAARLQCERHVADGTGVSEYAAKFQVYEGLLKAVSLNVWAAWMLDGSTPGYTVKSVKYVCNSGAGLGVSCRGNARICKL
jgi:hypothetical protein